MGTQTDTWYLAALQTDILLLVLKHLRRNFPASSSARVALPHASLHRLLLLKCVKSHVSVLKDHQKSVPPPPHVSPLLTGYCGDSDRVCPHPSVHTPSEPEPMGPKTSPLLAETGPENLQGSPVHSGTYSPNVQIPHMAPIRGRNKELKTSNSSPWSTCNRFPGTVLAPKLL